MAHPCAWTTHQTSLWCLYKRPRCLRERARARPAAPARLRVCAAAPARLRGVKRALSTQAVVEACRELLTFQPGSSH